MQFIDDRIDIGRSDIGIVIYIYKLGTIDRYEQINHVGHRFDDDNSVFDEKIVKIVKNSEKIMTKW